MKKVGLSLFIMFGTLLLSVSPALSSSWVWSIGRSEFDLWETHINWGLHLIYGQGVKVHYVAVDTFTVGRMDNGDGTWTVKQFLFRSGTAYIYDLEDNLIESRRYIAWAYAYGTADFNQPTWYHITSFTTVNRWMYHQYIPWIYAVFQMRYNGVYLGYVWIRGVGSTPLT